MKRVLETIRVEWMDGRRWRLVEEFIYHLHATDGEEYVVCRIGQITDFGSVPRLLWNIPGLNPTGKYAPAWLVHDKLFAVPLVLSDTSPPSMGRRIGFREANAILGEVLHVFGASWFLRALVRAAVSTGGWLAWREHRAQDAIAAAAAPDTPVGSTNDAP